VPNSAPIIENLNGDGVTYDAAPIRLDALADSAISDPDPFGFEVVRVGAGLAGGPLFTLEVPDGSGRMYVVEKSGTIRILDPATGTIAATPFLSVAGEVATSGEQGLLGFALSPDFATSGAFYIYMTNTSGDNEVRRYSILPGNMNQADPTTADRILLLPHPGATNHNAGWIDFGPDNLLYIPTGDGAVGANAQSLSSPLGKVLRIDPSSDAFPADPDRDYAIPAGNPYAGAIAGLDEIWASGLRNPFRASFDTLTGNLWIGDVGEGTLEEINLAPAGQAGLNFGWNLQEGTSGANNAAFTRPVAEYGHGSGPFQGNSITGGLVYRGPIAGLDGQYVFADFFDELWSVPVGSLVQGTTLPSSGFTLRDTAFTPNIGTINQITSFATDAAGNLYITDLGGEIFRVQPSATPNFAGGSLTVEIGAGEVPGEDRLGFAAGTVATSNGTNFGSQISVGGVPVGTIAPGCTGANGEPLVVLFSSGATQATIGALVQAITYSNASATPTPGTRSVAIRLNDGAGTGAGGQDTTIVTTAVAVSAGLGGELNGTPDDDVLVGGVGGDTLDGLAGSDRLFGAGGSDTLSGGDGDDILDTGTGTDTLHGNGGNDGFYFGANLDAGDQVDGGAGTIDQVGLQGDYSVGLTLGAGSLINTEMLVLLPGSDTRFGDPGTNVYSYNLTTSDANVVGGQNFIVSFNTLRAGENVTFNGAAETDGTFLTFGGFGNDRLTGGAGDDGFYFGLDRFGSGDALDGRGGSLDQLGLQGDYAGANAVVFGAGQLGGVEMIVCLTAADARFNGNQALLFSYDLTMNEGNLANGQLLMISANTLVAGESLAFDGSAETDGGRYTVFSGGGDDTLVGSAGADTFFGAAGADRLTGGGGDDTFAYVSQAHSTSAARDTILDFTAGDTIDLRAIDAIADGADDAFSFIGAAAFGHTAGQLRAVLQGGADWLVEGDVNGDGAADFALLVTVTGGHAMGGGDFLL